MERFENRREAGKALAERLRAFARDEDAIVLALPRGGVPVAFEIAQTLEVPLDVFIVRKLGVPGYEELAMGAIASGGAKVLNDEVMRRMGIPRGQLDRILQLERVEIERREWEYRGDLPPLRLVGKRIILVDDGLATGATMRAAVMALREAEVAEIIVAVPVGSREAVDQLGREADQIICLLEPKDFEAVGAWYEDFSQTSDEEVRDLLGQSRPVHF